MHDGAEAMAYLEGKGKYADRSKFPMPCVLIADLKMPKVDGFELLQWLRSHPTYQYLPMVVLTLSEEAKDIQKAYSLGANSFLITPPNIEDLKSVVRKIDAYWFKLNTNESKTHEQFPQEKPEETELMPSGES